MLLVAPQNSKYTFLFFYSARITRGTQIYYIIRVSYNDNAAVLKNGFRKQLGLLNINIYVQKLLNYIIFFCSPRVSEKIYDSIKRPGVRSRGNIFLLLQGKKVGYRIQYTYI